MLIRALSISNGNEQMVTDHVRRPPILVVAILSNESIPQPSPLVNVGLGFAHHWKS